MTVTDVQRASGVARTTIYRCFDNLSDILYWRCDLCFREALQPVKPHTQLNEWDLIRGYLSYWTAHSDILKLLVDIDRQDVIYACHMKNAKALEQSQGRLPGMDEPTARYFLALRTGVTISLLQAWMTGGRKETAEELVRILQRQVAYLTAGGDHTERDRATTL